ncbi:MAG: ferredoxin family protein [Candidatus Methylomirabilia bacterium]
MGNRVPLDWQAAVVPRGCVYVIPSRCKECRFCLDFCPKDVLVLSTSTNAKGYHYPTVAPGKEQACIHCEFCSLVCPEYAIYTIDDRPAEVRA